MTFSMSDEEWIGIALRYTCNLLNRYTEPLIYKAWSDDFKLEESKSAFEKFYGNENISAHFAVDMLNEKRCTAVGFGRWSDESDILLFPVWYTPFIPEGMFVTDIGGKTWPYCRAETDLDNRFGCLAFGLYISDLPKTIAV